MELSSMNEIQLKELLKASLSELIQEKPELFRIVLEDVLEDVGLGKAIEEGTRSGYVSEATIREALNP